MATEGLYLDYNGSTPVHPEVARACVEALQSSFGNPAAGHPAGRRARAAIERARAAVAAALSAASGEIWFTSGGTESNNWALFGSAPRAASGHLVVSAIEHKSVLAAAGELGRRGFELSLLPVGPAGAVDPGAVARALRPDTFLVAVMLANNETGVLQPVSEIGELCRARGVHFHCDAVAAIGKVPVGVREIGCDTLSISAHKMYAPKGCGVLYVRSGTELAPLIHGCGQQDGMRSGTENTPGVVALGRAFELLSAGEFRRAESPELRDLLWRRIRAIEPAAAINGSAARLPNTLSVVFPGSSGARLAEELGRLGVSCTAGSAGGDGAASHVLVAMDGDDVRARSTLRFTLGATTTSAEIERAAQALDAALEILRTPTAPGPPR